MKLGVIGVFVNQPYKNFIYGWMQNMNEYFLPDVEREWYIWTDEPDHPDIKNAPMDLQVYSMPRAMSKWDVWRRRWYYFSVTYNLAEADGCTHVACVQSNFFCLKKIDKKIWDEKMAHATDGSPCSTRHMQGLYGTEVQMGLMWGSINEFKTVVDFIRAKVEDDKWWKEACDAGLHDEYQISGVFMKNELKGVLGFADWGFSWGVAQDGRLSSINGGAGDCLMLAHKRNCVVVALTSGMGNMLFQLAFAIRYANKFGSQLLLSYSKKRNTWCPWLYNSVLERYFKDCDIFPSNLFKPLNIPTLIDDTWDGWEGSNVVLSGYGQSSYVSPEAEQIIREVCDEFTSKEQIPKSIGIHVRGGDYKYLALYRLINEFYLGIAFALSNYNDREHTVYVVTDDLELAKSLFNAIQNMMSLRCKLEYVVGDRGTADTIKAFKVLTAMEVLICSASTFSWWAAFLGKANKVYWPHMKEGKKRNDSMWKLKRDGWEWLEAEL